MTMTQVHAAKLLADARFVHRRLSELPVACSPSSAGEGYATQRQIVDLYLERLGGKPVGYKIACTNESAQRLLKVDGPFYGRLLSAFVHSTGCRLDPNQFFMRVIEPEFAFQMATDLPPTGVPYNIGQVTNAVGDAFPAIEVVDSRFDDWTTIGVPCLIADNACNGAWVKGPSCEAWKTLDLAGNESEIYVNGTLTKRGRGDAVMGHPLLALTWLANTLNSQGLMLRSGDMVSTGTSSEVYLAQAGDCISATFGRFGKVDLSF